MQVTFGSMTLLDKLHIMQALTAYADEEPTPAFYRDGELVGIYNPDYTSTETLKYSFDGVNWYNYELPITIPAYTPTTVYAKIGDNGAEVGDTFESSKLAIGAYTESTTDFSKSNQGVVVDYTRLYDSSKQSWNISTESFFDLPSDNLITVKMFNGNMMPFVRVSETKYVNEITGYELISVNANTYSITIDSLTYTYCLKTDFYALSSVSDSHNNKISVYFTNQKTFGCMKIQNGEYFANTLILPYSSNLFSSVLDWTPAYGRRANDPNNKKLSIF